MGSFADMLMQIASPPKEDLPGLGGPQRRLGTVASGQQAPDDSFTDASLMKSPGPMAYSHSMDDLIKNKYVAQSEAADAIPFYPSERHLEKNFAPERTLGRNEMERLAQARFRAVDMGVLDKDLADYMLPIAMVEGRPNSYGITHDNRFYASPHAKRVFAQMGLEIAPSKAHLKGTDSDPPLAFERDARGDKFITLTEAASDYKPELMAAILAIKAKGATSPEQAIERWNGGGEQARHYRGKVETAKRLMSHPKNSELMKVWDEVRGEE